MRPSLACLRCIPRSSWRLPRGDDGLLKIVARGLEARGIKVVGAHEIVPGLARGRRAVDQGGAAKIRLARHRCGPCGGKRHRRARHRPGGRRDRRPGYCAGRHRGHRRTARADAGSCAAMAGSPARRAACWSNAPSPVRNCAPICRPSVPLTVEAAHAAGLAGIAVEAGRSLILEGPAVIARANALGLFVVGLPAAEPAHGQLRSR